jgi:hypothetical protein
MWQNFSSSRLQTKERTRREQKIQWDFKRKERKEVEM